VQGGRADYTLAPKLSYCAFEDKNRVRGILKSITAHLEVGRATSHQLARMDKRRKAVVARDLLPGLAIVATDKTACCRRNCSFWLHRWHDNRCDPRPRNRCFTIPRAVANDRQRSHPGGSKYTFVSNGSFFETKRQQRGCALGILLA
jgi:hypothetical protein